MEHCPRSVITWVVLLLLNSHFLQWLIVFHISNKEETNISNKADVHYQWGANPLIKKPFLIGTLGNVNYYMTCTF